MNAASEQLIELLNLEKLDMSLFRGIGTGGKPVRGFSAGM